MKTTPIPTTAALTWQTLVDLDGRLDQLLDEARRTHDIYRDRPFCANAYWYGLEPWKRPGLVGRMQELVGMTRRDWRNLDVLGSAAAYELAYRTLSEALSFCHGGACECG